ncbi:hypothetical protein [Oerskovia enterophila]|uniref:hypothetical protein n=1 Tax=Oerskovia enterophila TaxID=43678 RepID=UPI00382CE9C3
MSRQTTSHPSQDPLVAIAAYAPAPRIPDSLQPVRDQILRDGTRVTTAAATYTATKNTRAPRHRGALVGAVATGALALTVGLAVPWLSQDDAYATWTATPTALSGEALADAETACDIVVPAPAATTVLAEQRGIFTFTLRTDDREVMDCLLDEDGTGGLSSTNLDSLREPTKGEVTIVTYFTTWNPNNGHATAIYGRTGDEVSAVNITRSNGFKIEATVSNGWWAAWWPGDTDPDATVTMHHSDGTSSKPVNVDDPTILDVQ